MTANVCMIATGIFALLGFGTLCLNVKLYTEILKEKSQRNRQKPAALPAPCDGGPHP